MYAVSGGTVSNLRVTGSAGVLVSGGTAVGLVADTSGTVDVSDGGRAFGTTVLLSGAEVVEDGGVETGAVVAGGTLQVFGTGVLNGATFTGGVIELQDGTNLTGVVSSVAVGDVFEFTGELSSSLTVSGDSVTVAGTDTIAIRGAAFDSFALSQVKDADGESVLALTVTAVGTPCYCPGTRILTDRGAVPVEALAVGDRLVTLDGPAEPIRWIGRRAYAGRFIGGNRDILPVRIRAGALDNGLPNRDLLVSPLHAMFLDGMLVPAGALVNGATVTQDAAADAVHYIHLELDRHAVIFAEGAASETFVDDDSRAMFQNAHEHAAAFPDHVPVPASYCAPRVVDGEVLARIKRGIDARAGLVQPGDGDALRGHVDGWEGRVLRGWAQNPDRPEVAVCLDVVVDGEAPVRVLANLFRADLRAAGLGSGCHSFRAVLPAGAAGRTVTVRRTADGAVLGTAAASAPFRQAG